MIKTTVGRMRWRLKLQAQGDPVETADAYGQPAPTWNDVITLWGEVKPLSGRELFNAQQVQAQVTHQISVRYTGSAGPIDETMRFLYTASSPARIFNITAALNVDERNREYQVLAIEQKQPVLSQ